MGNTKGAAMAPTTAREMATFFASLATSRPNYLTDRPCIELVGPTRGKAYIQNL
jgi:hypothetical protein